MVPVILLRALLYFFLSKNRGVPLMGRLPNPLRLATREQVFYRRGIVLSCGLDSQLPPSFFLSVMSVRGPPSLVLPGPFLFLANAS